MSVLSLTHARRSSRTAPARWRYRWERLARRQECARTTSQVLTDIGRAPAFYDCRVELELASTK